MQNVKSLGTNDMIPSRSDRIRRFLYDFAIFVFKQGYACVFGGFLVVMIVITRYFYPLEESIHRYDFLFLMAVAFQIFLIALGWEKRNEILVIGVFHIVAMCMEVFKTHPSIGSWHYPEAFSIGILGVPLFAGFMYSAVGSYIARVWRIFAFRYEQYPSKISTLLLIICIYINFFTHHYIWDMRYILFIWVFFLFGRTKIFFRPHQKYYSMNLIVGFSLVASVIWIAENIATYTRVWIYPNQIEGWHMVGVEKISAWFLLMIMSFVLVSLLHSPEKQDA